MSGVEFSGETARIDDTADHDETVDHVPDNMAAHFAGAYEKGALARRRGEDQSANPYIARYNPDSAMGGEWGHVWSNAWRLGWENERREQEGESILSYRKAWKMGR